jgi:2C-methyl-D-erythritol 2,4-cyclodiphosphate synthase
MSDTAFNVSEILARALIAIGGQREADLARAMGRRQGVLSNWRARNTVPLEDLWRLSEARNVSLRWLLIGEGPMLRGGIDTRKFICGAVAFELGRLALEERDADALAALHLVTDALLSRVDPEAVSDRAVRDAIQRAYLGVRNAGRIAELYNTMRGVAIDARWGAMVFERVFQMLTDTGWRARPEQLEQDRERDAMVAVALQRLAELREAYRTPSPEAADGAPPAPRTRGRKRR